MSSVSISIFNHDLLDYTTFRQLQSTMPTRAELMEFATHDHAPGQYSHAECLVQYDRQLTSFAYYLWRVHEMFCIDDHQRHRLWVEHQQNRLLGNI